MKLFVLTTSCIFSFAIFYGCKSPKNKPIALTQNQEIEFQRVYIEGVNEFVLKNYKLSDSLFKICLKFKPEESALYFMKAKGLCAMLNFDQALLDLNSALKFNSGNTEIHILHADILAHKGYFEEAGKELELLYSQNIKRSYFARQAIDYYMSGGFVDQSLRIFNAMESQFGIREDIIFGKESLYSSTNRFSESAREMLKLIDKYPNRYSYLEKLASIYQRGGDLEKCEQTISKLLVLDPDNGFGLLTMADLWLRKNNSEKEYEYLFRAFSLSSIAFEVKQSAITGYSLKHPNAITDGKLLALAELIANTHPNVPLAQVILADIQFENKNYKEALPKYKGIIKDFNLNADIYRKYLTCFEVMAHWDSLVLYSTKALEIFPNNFIFYYFNAEGLSKIKRYTDALLSLKLGRSFAFSPEDILVIKLLEADIASSEGDFLKCRIIYDDLIINNTNNALVMNNYAFHLANSKFKLDYAIELSEKALKLEPLNSSYLDTYSWILFVQEKYGESLIYIEKALKLNGLNAEILEHAGDIYFKNNLKEKALEYWLKSKQNGGNGINLEQKIKERKWFG